MNVFGRASMGPFRQNGRNRYSIVFTDEPPRRFTHERDAHGTFTGPVTKVDMSPTLIAGRQPGEG
jgi:hypothetical protein